MATHNDYGKLTEDLALQWWLEKFSVRLIARNYRCKMGELDLVFECGSGKSCELIFVEVRARQAGAWLSGIESIGPKKRQRLRKTIGHFLVRYSGQAKQMRFDVLSRDGESWTHLQNVWF